jgi:hypothetical protein
MINEKKTSETIYEANCVFEQPWFLDIVAPGQWAEASVRDGNGKIVARMPYQAKRTRMGFSCIVNPQLCQTAGPWVMHSDQGAYANRLGKNHELLLELFSNLPDADTINFQLHPSVFNPLPFRWMGYAAGLGMTYRITDLADLDAVFFRFTDKCRNVIRKAEKHVDVRDDLPFEIAWDLVEKTWLRQGLRVPYDKSTLFRLVSACQKMGSGKLLFAVGADTRPHAFVFLIYDSNVAYYLLGAADPELRSSGAQYLLIWRGLQYLKDRTKVFDFEGSSNRNIEHFVRSFGAVQTPLLNIQKVSPRQKIYSSLRTLLPWAR